MGVTGQTLEEQDALLVAVKAELIKRLSNPKGQLIGAERRLEKKGLQILIRMRSDPRQDLFDISPQTCAVKDMRALHVCHFTNPQRHRIGSGAASDVL